jgi:cytochrome c peroxidase
LTEDPGRYLITKDKKDWKAFKTPTLLEIAKTGPYMHNGTLQTLDEVIEFTTKEAAREYELAAGLSDKRKSI